jgi:hypothetical protein
VTTSDDDNNGWRLRVTPDNPDGRPGTGDEISIGNVQASYQNAIFGCHTFYVPVVPGQSSIILSIFDGDMPALCPVGCSAVYTTPSGTAIPGTVSGSTEWSGGGTSYPPSEDFIEYPEPGMWEATLCLNDPKTFHGHR